MSKSATKTDTSGDQVHPMVMCFVRFGDIPESGKSQNHLSGAAELGVSVYEALERGGKYQILLPKIDPVTITTLGMCYNVAQGIYAYTDQALFLVDGDFVGYGSDGEPLLQNCKIIKQIMQSQIIEKRPLNT